MTPQYQDCQAILLRLEKVEKTNRALKCVLLALCCLLGFFLTVKPTIRVHAAEIPQVLETQELRIKDPGGRVRAEIRASDGGVAILLLDKEGEQRVGIATGGASTGLVLDAPDGKTKIGLLTDNHGPSLGFYDSSGVRSYLTLEGLEAQKFTLKDTAGNERGSLFATEPSWGLVLYNPDSSKGAAVTVMRSLGSAVMVMNKKGGGISAMANEEGNTFAVTDPETLHTAVEVKTTLQGAGLRLVDPAGTDRVDLTLPRTGESGIILNDANSQTRTALLESSPGLATFDAKGAFVWSAGFDGLPKEAQDAIRAFFQKSGQKKP